MALVTLTTPNPNDRRRVLLDAILKGLDVTVGIVALVAGVFALVSTPPSIIREISLPFLVVLWGVLLIVGGFGSALGRLTGVWIIETTGLAGASSGALIYLVVVSTAIVDSLGVAVAICLILIGLLAMVRRYVELQIFLSEPDEPDLIARVRALLRIRTESTLRS